MVLSSVGTQAWGPAIDAGAGGKERAHFGRRACEERARVGICDPGAHGLEGRGQGDDQAACAHQLQVVAVTRRAPARRHDRGRAVGDPAQGLGLECAEFVLASPGEELGDGAAGPVCDVRVEIDEPGPGELAGAQADRGLTHGHEADQKDVAGRAFRHGSLCLPVSLSGE